MWESKVMSEWEQSRALRQAEIDFLVRAGVPHLALSRDPGAYGFTVMVDGVVFDGPRFEFARNLPAPDGAVNALIFVARDQAGDVIDLVAARLADNQIGSHFGRVCLLGQQHLWAPRLSGDALNVHADVLGFMRDDRHGVVVVDAERARWLLADAGRLRVENERQCRELRSDLRLREPHIEVAAGATYQQVAA